MKTIANIRNFAFLFVLSLISTVQAFAQEKGLDVNITKTTETTTSSNWYANPWIWIVGVAVFILLFAAIIRGRSTDA